MASSKTQHALELFKRSNSVKDRDDFEKAKPTVRSALELSKNVRSLIPVLGMLIHIRNKPFTDGMFSQFEELFNTQCPPVTVLKCGRQVGKSSNFAAKTILLSALIPYFQTLTVTPQFEMTRRYSTNYIRPLLEFSPIASWLLDQTCERSVLQKTLSNQSIMHFSFAFLNCDRVRGISADRIHGDEIQDIDFTFLDEIAQTMGRSEWRITDYSGTPKTLDNTMHALWEKSSKAEWLIPCNCGHINNPMAEADGIKMIGDYTLVCAKCGKPVDSDQGYWEHLAPEKAHKCTGLHVPQLVLPFHYQNKRRWEEIVTAKNGRIAKKTFMNEIMGEACDIGAKLLTETDLKRACVLPTEMDIQKATRFISDYPVRALGVDWGGRGEDTLSFTKACVLGMRTDGRCDLLYGESLSYLTDGGEEVARVIDLYKYFSCNLIAHDAGGTAGMRDVLFAHAGFPMNRVLPMCYVTAWTKEILTFNETTESVRRPYYSIDKTKSLLVAVECIKNQYLFFPAWESCKDLLADFLGLIEEKTESRRGGDVYLVRRAANLCDDFAHATNFALMALFHTQGKWPNLVESIRRKSSLSKEQMAILNPSVQDISDWGEQTGKKLRRI